MVLLIKAEFWCMVLVSVQPLVKSLAPDSRLCIEVCPSAFCTSSARRHQRGDMQAPKGTFTHRIGPPRPRPPSTDVVGWHRSMCLCWTEIQPSPDPLQPLPWLPEAHPLVSSGTGVFVFFLLLWGLALSTEPQGSSGHSHPSPGPVAWQGCQ